MTYWKKTKLFLSVGIFIGFASSCTASLESFEDDSQSSQQGNAGNNNGNDDDGPGQSGTVNQGIFNLTAPLSCDSVAMCMSYQAPRERVPEPQTRGGEIRDGVYMLVEGENAISAYVFNQGTYRLVWNDLTGILGTYELDDGFILFRGTTSCTYNGTFPVNNPIISNREYMATENDLFIIPQCGFTGDCSGAYRFKRVDSFCGEVGNLECLDGECYCHEFVEEPIPAPAQDGTDRCAIN